MNPEQYQVISSQTSEPSPLASESIGPISNQSMSPFFREVQDLAAASILKIVSAKIAGGASIMGVGIPQDECNAHLSLQRSIHLTCSALSRAIPESWSFIASAERPEQNLSTLAEQHPDQKDLLLSLDRDLTSLLEAAQGLPESGIIINTDPTPYIIEEIARLQGATHLNPFDGRIEDLGFSTVSLGVEGVRLMCKNGVRFNCALNDDSKMIGFTAYFPPEAIRPENPFTKKIADLFPDTPGMGVLTLILCDSAASDPDAIPAPRTDQSLYRRLLLSTWLSLQNDETNTVVGLVHENNHKAAIVHSMFGGAEIQFDKTVTTGTTLRPLTEGPEVTPPTVFFAFSMNTCGTGPIYLQTRQALNEGLGEHRLANAENDALRVEQRLRVLGMKQQLLKWLEIADRNPLQIGSGDSKVIRELLQETLAGQSQSIKLWQSDWWSDAIPLQDKITATRRELPQPASLEKEIFRLTRGRKSTVTDA